MRNEHMQKLLQQCGVQLLASGGGLYTYNNMDIRVEGDSNGAHIYLFYCVGTWPAHPPMALVENILKANFLGAATRGGHLGLQGERGALIYSLRVETAVLNVQSLQNTLHLFATTALELVQSIEDWNKADPRTEALQQEIILPIMAGIRV